MLKKILACLVCMSLAFAPTIGWSQNRTFTDFITAAPPATLPPTTADRVPIIQGGATKNIPATSIGRTSARTNPTPGEFFVATVAAGGNDAYDCLSATVSGGHGPCATINTGLAALMKMDAGGSSMILNVAAGSYKEVVTVNGSPPGLASAGVWDDAYSQPQVIIKGAGSATTEIQNAPTFAGPRGLLGYCYTVLAVNGAYLALQDISIRSDNPGGPCPQANLYVQLATMYTLHDVVLKSATGNHIMLEEAANFYNTPGYHTYPEKDANGVPLTAPGLTIAGNAGYGIVATGNSMFVSDSSIRIKGPITFRYGLFLFADDHSDFKLWGGNPAFDCVNSSNVSIPCTNQIVSYHHLPEAAPGDTQDYTVYPRPYGLYGNSMLMVGFPPYPWPAYNGVLGIVANGSRYRGGINSLGAVDSGACIANTIACPQNTTPFTGLGSGGSVGVSGGSGAYGGYAELWATPGAASTGSVYIGFPFEMDRGVCVPTRANGLGIWNPAATFTVGSFTTAAGLAIAWSNNGVPLSPGLNYFLGWVCQTGQ